MHLEFTRVEKKAMEECEMQWLVSFLADSSAETLSLDPRLFRRSFTVVCTDVTTSISTLKILSLVWK